MAIPITRAEYEKKFGVAPKVSADTFDTTPPPQRVTRAEWEALQNKWHPKPEQTNIFTPAKEAVQGLGTLYGGGEQGIARTLQRDVTDAAQNIQNAAEAKQRGLSFGQAANELAKGIVKGGARTAGDVAGTVFAPVGAAIQATGFNHLTDWLGKELVDSSLGQVLTDNPAVQEFAIKHPNAGEDFNRVLNLTLSKAERGDIKPQDVVQRTLDQVKATTENVKHAPQKVVSTLSKDTSVQRQKDLHNIEKRYAATRKANDYSKDGNAASRARIADADIWNNVVDNTGKLDTTSKGGAYDQYKAATIKGRESVVRDTLSREGATVNINEIANAMRKNVLDSGLEGGDLATAIRGIEKDIKGLTVRADEFGNIPLEKLHDAKISATDGINFLTEPHVKSYRKTIARTYKEVIENKSKTNVKELNGELAKYYKDLELIKNLNGRIVDGGKLGKYFAQTAGTAIGGIAGATGGPVGSIVGGIVGGEVAGALKGRALRGALGKGGKEIPRNEILDAARKEAGLPPVKDLKTPDKAVGAPKGTPKTREITALEGKIKKNVKDQKKAIKAGNFDLVALLKEGYANLVTKLKASIKESVQNLKEGRIGLSIKSTVTPEGVAKKITNKDFNMMTNGIGDIRTERLDPDFNAMLKKHGLDKASNDTVVKFMKEVTDIAERNNPPKPKIKPKNKISNDLATEAKKANE